MDNIAMCFCAKFAPVMSLAAALLSASVTDEL